MEEVLGGLKGQNFILDGFPRNTVQADALADLLNKLSLKVDKVVFVEVPLNLLLGRLAGRRVCRNCGAGYHVEAKPSKKTGNQKR